MKELEVIEIDGIKYGIIKEAKHNDTIYLYLANINNLEDTLIRKQKENGDVIPLDSEKEFDLACSLLLKESLI